MSSRFQALYHRDEIAENTTTVDAVVRETGIPLTSIRYLNTEEDTKLPYITEEDLENIEDPPLFANALFRGFNIATEPKGGLENTHLEKHLNSARLAVQICANIGPKRLGWDIQEIYKTGTSRLILEAKHPTDMQITNIPLFWYYGFEDFHSLQKVSIKRILERERVLNPTEFLAYLAYLGYTPGFISHSANNTQEMGDTTLTRPKKGLLQFTAYQGFDEDYVEEFYKQIYYLIRSGGLETPAYHHLVVTQINNLVETYGLNSDFGFIDAPGEVRAIMYSWPKVVLPHVLELVNHKSARSWSRYCSGMWTTNPVTAYIRNVGVFSYKGVTRSISDQSLSCKGGSCSKCKVNSWCANNNTMI